MFEGVKPLSSSIYQVRNYGHGHFARDSNLDADTVEITAIYTNDLPPTATTGINGLALYYNFEHATTTGSSTTSGTQSIFLNAGSQSVMLTYLRIYIIIYTTYIQTFDTSYSGTVDVDIFLEGNSTDLIKGKTTKYSCVYTSVDLILFKANARGFTTPTVSPRVKSSMSNTPFRTRDSPPRSTSHFAECTVG